MGKLRKVRLRWISLLCVAGLLLISGGCGGGGGGDSVDTAANNGGNSGGDNSVPDTTPDAFTIAPQTGVALHAEVTSAPVTVTGINTSTPITVTNGSYSMGDGPFVTIPGTVTNNQTVRVRHRASAYGSNTVTTTVNIGGVVGTFRSTTKAPPDPFSLTPQTNTPLGATVTSNQITVSGIAAPSSIWVMGGSYSIDNGAFTTSRGTVSNGQRVTVRHTAASTSNTTTSTRLTIGRLTGYFNSSTGDTVGLDVWPDRVTFAPLTDVPLDTDVTSAPVTIIGIDAPVHIRVGGGDSAYSIDGGPFTSAAGTVSNGQTVRIRQRSAPRYGLTALSLIDIGEMELLFTSTTQAAPQ